MLPGPRLIALYPVSTEIGYRNEVKSVAVRAPRFEVGVGGGRAFNLALERNLKTLLLQSPHFVLFHEGGKHFVRPIGGAPLFINKRRVSSSGKQLEHGDVISCELCDVPPVLFVFDEDGSCSSELRDYAMVFNHFLEKTATPIAEKKKAG